MITLLLLCLAAQASDVVTAVSATRELRASRLATEAPIIPDWAYEQAEAGTAIAGLAIEAGQPIAKGWGVRIIDLPIEAAWMALSDEPSFPEQLRVTHSTVISGTHGRTGRTVFQFMPLPIIRDRWWIVEVTHNAALYTASSGVLWEKKVADATDRARLEGLPEAAIADGGHPLGWTRGAWLLQRLSDDRTLLEYFVWTDIGGSIPSGPVSRFAKGAIRDTVDAITTLSEGRVGVARDGYVKPDGTPL